MEKAFEELQIKDDFTRELDEAVQAVRKNEKWRLDYMTLQMNYQEKYEQGVEHEKMETARRLIELEKFSIEEIASVTELSVEKIKEIVDNEKTCYL